MQLSGKVTGTATTDASGSFSVQLKATALGTVSAATTDGQSNVAQVTLTDPAATITSFGWIEYPNNMFVFSGHVNGGYSGEVVSFGGLKSLQGQTTTVDANGNFSLVVRLDGTMADYGTATAQAVDAWGVQSNLATTWVTPT